MTSKAQFSLWGDFFAAFLPFFAFASFLALLLVIPGCGGLSQIEQTVEQQIDEAIKLRVEHDLIALLQHEFTLNYQGTDQRKSLYLWFVELAVAGDSGLKNDITEELDEIASDFMCGKFQVSKRVEIRARAEREARFFNENFGECGDGDRSTAVIYLPVPNAADGVLEVELEEKF